MKAWETWRPRMGGLRTWRGSFACVLERLTWGELGLGCVLAPRLHGGEAGKPREGCRLAGDAGGATGVRPHSPLGG